MENNQLILEILAAMAVGGIIGLEREKNKQLQKSLTPIGIRTDILISLFGFLSFKFSELNGTNVIFIIALCTIALISIFSYAYLTIAHKKMSIKTALSTLIVFMLGALCAANQIFPAVMVAIATTAALSLKEFLHSTVKNVSYNEIIDAIKFVVIAFIILPFLPNHAYDLQIAQLFSFSRDQIQTIGNLNLINPYKIWFIIVLISGVEFLGYILSKLIGHSRGIAISGFMGGIYSSTATSLHLAKSSKSDTVAAKRDGLAYLSGILFACGSSFFKMMIVIQSINQTLFFSVIPTMTIMFIYFMITGAIVNKFSPKKTNKSDLKTPANPFSLISAIKLGVFLVTTILIANLILLYTNTDLYFVMAGLMAFLSIDDPIIISTANIAGTLITMEMAKNIILTAITLNFLQKILVVRIFGSRKIFKPALISFSGLILVLILGILYF